MIPDATTATTVYYILFFLFTVVGMKDVTRCVKGNFWCNWSQQTTNRSAIGYSNLPVRERLA